MTSSAATICRRLWSRLLRESSARGSAVSDARQRALKLDTRAANSLSTLPLVGRVARRSAAKAGGVGGGAVMHEYRLTTTTPSPPLPHKGGGSTPSSRRDHASNTIENALECLMSQGSFDAQVLHTTGGILCA
jgi:hypothetical protein